MENTIIISYIIVGVVISIALAYYESGRWIKVGQVIREFHDCEEKKENPYIKNYADYQVVNIQGGFCKVRDVETNVILVKKLENIVCCSTFIS